MQKKIQIFMASLLFVMTLPVNALAVETPTYEVVIKHEDSDDIEIRQYPSMIFAQSILKESKEGDFKESRSNAFKKLFSYIDGANDKLEDIPMTTPVFINKDQFRKTSIMSFVMPAKFMKGHSLPKPTDSDIALKAQKPITVAAIRYSGRSSKENEDENLDKLQKWIEENSYNQTSSQYWIATYDPPWMPWFLKRNEILIPIYLESSI